MMKSGKIYSSVDLFKFFFAIIVISIHTHPFVNLAQGILYKIYYIFCISAVPFFFIASGFFLGDKLSIRNFNQTLNSDIKILVHYLKKNIKLYLIWTFIYLPLAIYDFSKSNNSVAKLFLIYIKQVLFVGENFNSWPLWYLLSTIYCYLFLLVCNRLPIKRIIIIGFIVFFCNQLIDMYLHMTENDGGGYMRLVLYRLSSSRRLLKSFVYIPLGILVSKKTVVINTYVLVCLLFFTGVIAYFLPEYGTEMIIFLFTSFMFILILRIDIKGNFFLLRRLSTNMYFLHMWVYSLILFISKLCSFIEIQQEGMKVFILTLVVTIILSILLNYLKKIGKTEKITKM